METTSKSIFNKLIINCAIILLFITVIFLLFFFNSFNKEDVINRNRQTIVDLNEIEKLTEVNGKSPASDKIHNVMDNVSKCDFNLYDNTLKYTIFMYIMVVLFFVFIMVYVYISMFRPFKTLENYASYIARGDFNVKLPYRKTNMFGAFTWAFDHMRCEVTKSRQNEKQAIENNKTIIATLSHDIKTPISSIRAYTEALEACINSSFERREKYLKVIMKKCDEVTKLTNDLVLHSLSSLNKLSIDSEKINIGQALKCAIEDISVESDNIICTIDEEDVYVNADIKRVNQIIENIISNSRKYSNNKKIEVWTCKLTEGKKYEIHIKDNGEGIPPDDLPFIFNKFYRGKNSKIIDGSGLGLYIVKYLMENMNGSVILNNSCNGLEVILSFCYIS